jgi:hypothetical protein
VADSRRLLLGGILLLAIAVRFAGIGSRLSIDDAYSWYAASSPTAHVFLDRLAANENTPPLIYLLLMLMPGSQPFWLRVPAAVPGVLLCAVLFYALRSRLGDRPALLAALAVAVAPYLITYSNLARGFMLADLALLGAVWSLLSLADGETRLKWVALLGCCVVAIWTEYASVITVIALIAGACWAARSRWRPMLLTGALALATLAVWIPQIVRGQNQVGLTKFDPASAEPSLTALRDMVVTLALGEHGGTSSSAGRWLEFAVMVALGVVAALALRRTWAARDARGRGALRILGATALLTPIGYALAALVGVHVFTQRYITIEVPLVAALAAAALSSVKQRALLPAAVVCLAALGFIGVGRRLGGEWEPNLAPMRLAAERDHARTVLTNTPVVLYYLASFRPLFDRPSNLGPGRSGDCLRPCLAVDDTRIHAGTPRPMPGERSQIKPYVLTLKR